jgi:hypothetical protein
MEMKDFNKKLRNLEPGRKLVYHTGNLAVDRIQDDELNMIGALALAVAELNVGAVFQKRITARIFDYEVRVFRRLGLRVDGNGAYQEVQRLARLYAKDARESALEPVAL